MRNRKRFVLYSILGGFVLCFATVTGLTMYHVVHNPAIRAGVHQVQDAFQAMFDLQYKIAAAFPADNVEINMHNGNVLTVTLVNSDMNALTAEAQKDKAREIALFARRNYQDIEPIQAIRVVFVRHQRYLIFNYNQTMMYGFTIEELKAYETDRGTPLWWL